MSDRENMFTGSSLQTFTAASFVLALFAMGMGVYNSTRTAQAVSAILDLQVHAMNSDEAKEGATTAMSAQDARITTLEGRIQALEAAAAAPAAVATTP